MTALDQLLSGTAQRQVLTDYPITIELDGDGNVILGIDPSYLDDVVSNLTNPIIYDQGISNASFGQNPWLGTSGSAPSSLNIYAQTNSGGGTQFGGSLVLASGGGSTPYGHAGQVVINVGYIPGVSAGTDLAYFYSTGSSAPTVVTYAEYRTDVVQHRSNNSTIELSRLPTFTYEEHITWFQTTGSAGEIFPVTPTVDGTYTIIYDIQGWDHANNHVVASKIVALFTVSGGTHTLVNKTLVYSVGTLAFTYNCTVTTNLNLILSPNLVDVTTWTVKATWKVV